MRILVLTSVYRDDSLGSDDTSTNVVNSFVNSWKQQGHDILVFHNAHRYPYFIHALPGIVRDNLASKMGFSIPKIDTVSRKSYENSGVPVIRIPIRKYRPHCSPSEKEIKRQFEAIVKTLNERNFIPDVIVGHWASPQMELLYYLKEVYSCPNAIVFHGLEYLSDASFKAAKYLERIDCIGVRSEYQAKQITNLMECSHQPFVCYSGIPDSFLDAYTLNTEKFLHLDTLNVVFVGRLVKYKKVDAIIRSLSRIKEKKWKLDIIGDGAEKSNLEQLAKDLHCSEDVHFLGRIPRNKVLKAMSEAHVFVMISVNEVFGLVYLEAMAASCIPIASRNGGVDGIVIDGNNGFLCAEGSSDELTSIIRHILQLSSAELQTIASNAYHTAKEFSDSKVARNYLSSVAGDIK